MSVHLPRAVIAEDEAILRLEAAEMLRELGFEVLEAMNATEALKQIETNANVQLLYTDVEMPGSDRDGFRLAREVAQRWPGVGIIICSSCLPPKPGDLPARTHFLGKPCGPKRVSRIVHSLQTSP